MAVFAQTYRTAEIFFGNAAGAIIHDTEKIIDSIGAENARHYFYLQMLVACDNLSMNHCAACEQNSVAIKAPAHEGRGAFCAK